MPQILLGVIKVARPKFLQIDWYYESMTNNKDVYKVIKLVKIRKNTNGAA